jgi:CRISPR-associated protein Csb1
LHRSAQYSTIAGEILESGDVEVTTKGPKAELGLAHVPAACTHGGVQVLGEIRRDAILKLATIRALAGPDEGATLRLRRYVLGLALVSFTAPPETCLREGCELVPDPKRPVEWKLVKHDGTREDAVITHGQAISFANAAAKEFGVYEAAKGFEDGVRTVAFNSELANLVRDLKEDDRKKLRKQGPITKEKIENLKKEPKSKGKTKDAAKEAQS